jgi:hypothetical protein
MADQHERRKDLDRRERFEHARAAVLDRLRRVCHDWPMHELEMLSAKMTRLQLKYDSWAGLSMRRD